MLGVLSRLQFGNPCICGWEKIVLWSQLDCRGYCRGYFSCDPWSLRPKCYTFSSPLIHVINSWQASLRYLWVTEITCLPSSDLIKMFLQLFWILIMNENRGLSYLSLSILEGICYKWLSDQSSTTLNVNSSRGRACEWKASNYCTRSRVVCMRNKEDKTSAVKLWFL